MVCRESRDCTSHYRPCGSKPEALSNLETNKNCMVRSGMYMRLQYMSCIFREATERVSEFNPIALRKAKIVCNFGLSECNRVNHPSPFIQLWNYKILVPVIPYGVSQMVSCCSELFVKERGISYSF